MSEEELRARIAELTRERDQALAKQVDTARLLETANSANEKTQAKLAKAVADAEAAAKEHAAAVKTARDESATAAAAADKSMKEAREAAARDVIRAEARAAASQLGIRDPADALRMLDFDKIARTEDGNITGLDAALAELQASKPYLFQAPAATAAETGTIGQPTPKPSPPLDPQPFDARKATPEDLKAQAEKLGIRLPSIS